MLTAMEILINLSLLVHCFVLLCLDKCISTGQLLYCQTKTTRDYFHMYSNGSDNIGKCREVENA